MKLDRYFYITSLPALGELGTAPPIGFAELWEVLSDDRRWRALVGGLLLLDDLLQREAYLAGECPDVEPTVLSVQQARNESPLPEFLAAADAADAATPLRRIAVDDLWEAYFRHVARTAAAWRSPFLAAWVTYEVSLRNALAAARAERLGLDPAAYLVAADLVAAEATEVSDVPHADLLTEWSAAPTPLAGWQRLLRARWDWLELHDAHYSFREDELLVYAARLMVLTQWQRVAGNA